MPAPDWTAIEARGGEVVRPVRWKLALAAAGLAAFAALAGVFVGLLVADGVTGSEPAWSLAWALLATLWGALAFRLVVRLLRREPLVAYDADAVYLPGVGAVGWDEVAAVRVDEIGRGRSPMPLVGIYLHDPAPVLARAGVRRRLEGRFEAAARRAPLSVTPHSLPMELWVLVGRLERRREAAQRRRDSAQRRAAASGG